MKIYCAADHAGFELKNKIKEMLIADGHEVEDCGAHELNKEDDYPEFMMSAAHAVAADKGSRGIIIGGSGQGEAMVANRVRGVRAAVYYGGEEEIIKLSRQHNDANVLSLGARFIKEDEAIDMVKLWLQTPFSEEERHKRRLQQF